MEACVGPRLTRGRACSIRRQPAVPEFRARARASLSAEQVFARFRVLLDLTHAALEAAGEPSRAYNVALLPTFIVLIPRTHRNRDGRAPGNAMAMLGLIWVSSEEHAELWKSLGVTKHLTHLGLAADTERPSVAG
jgi:ATP adenylyltransferase/5',5'''-P-1,P-4-tetraphosphate phosphorylase II